MANGTRIPKVMASCGRAPIGPLYSIGATSVKYFGQKREKAPADAPKRKRPITNIGNESKMHITEPASTRILVKRIQFLLPMAISGPPKRAPAADPAIVIH